MIGWRFILVAGLLVWGPATVARAGTLPTVRVIIHDHAFQPRVIHVKAGQQIVWTNTDQDPHTVTSGANNIDNRRWKSSPLIADGQSFALRLTRPGTYPYFCKPHEFEASMHGIIIVSRM